MAVVKANFVRRGKGDRARAKATLRYITHRRDRQGRASTRQLMGFDGLLTKEQAYRMIDEAKRGTVFYRLVISPDPAREDRFKDLSLTDIALFTLYKLEERLGKHVQFIAAHHDNHSPNRHTHMIVLVQGRLLTKQDFQSLRQEATEQARTQRRTRDLYQPQQTRGRPRSSQARPAHIPVPGYIRREAEHAPRPLSAYTCPVCSFNEVKASTNRVLAAPNRCLYCGVRMKRQQQFAPALNKALGGEGYS